MKLIDTMADRVALYNNTKTDLDLKSASDTLHYIEEQVIPGLLQNDKDFVGKILFQKISKNDNIERVVNKLNTFDLNNNFVCIYSYGPHVQKMLSIVEIFKKMKTVNKDTKIIQWNKLTMFKLIEEGRNELLEKKTIIPICITFITCSETLTSTVFENDQNKFTKQ